jgi:hypothetical protein
LPSGILWFHFVCGHALPPFHFSFLQMRFSMCGRQLNSTKTVWNILFFFGRDIIFTSNRTTHHLRNKKIQNEFWLVRKSRNCIHLYHHFDVGFLLLRKERKKYEFLWNIFSSELWHF